MTRETYLYGCRSGIQKGLRRGDLNLVHTCFEALWGAKKFRDWLKWRIHVLVAEDVSYMTGELARFLAAVPNEPEAEKICYKRFILKLTLLAKNRDFGGLLAVATHTPEERGEHPELSEARYVARLLIKTKDLAPSLRELGDLICSKIIDQGVIPGDPGLRHKLSQYEMSAIECLRARAHLGGMPWDMKTYIMGMLLIAMRGLPEKEIKEYVRGQILANKVRLGSVSLSRVGLPWYVFDMHTRPGLRAMGRFKKFYPDLFYKVDNFKLLWFQMESAYFPPGAVHYLKMTPTAKPTWLDCMWWLEELKCSGLKSKTMRPAEVAKWWRKEVRPKLKRLVLEELG